MPFSRVILCATALAIIIHAGWRAERIAATVITRDKIHSALTDDTTAKLRAGLGDLHDDVFVPVLAAAQPSDRFLLVTRPSLHAHDVHHILGHLLFPIRMLPVIYPPDAESVRTVIGWLGDTKTVWVLDLDTSIQDEMLGLRFLDVHRTRSGTLYRAEMR